MSDNLEWIIVLASWEGLLPFVRLAVKVYTSVNHPTTPSEMRVFVIIGGSES